MTLGPYDWPLRGSFKNRLDDLQRLEEWWDSPSRDALCLYGRRRVGKSWLFRAFAHGKPALLLVADRRTTRPQMARFADVLEPLLGVKPDIPDVPSLLKALYRLGREEKRLVVLDEFPYLIPDGAARDRLLTALQGVMEEEREHSQTKLVLCGSLISQMESLLEQSSPLHGRLRPLDIRPLTFSEAQGLLNAADTPAQLVERYAVAGGTAKYLAELGGPGDLKPLVCRHVLDQRGSLFSDPRNVLERELRQPATYFTILEELAERERSIDHIAETLQVGSNNLTSYLENLKRMRLISELTPVGAPANFRGRKYRIDDGFVRFWFRFVFPHQESLESGLRPEDLWDGEIHEFLAGHVSPTFESLCQRWCRLVYGSLAPTIGSWWGDALHEERQAKRRMTEEIDVVGAHRRRLRLVGECKWTSSPMPASVLTDLQTYKLPALYQGRTLRQANSEEPLIVLFSKSGFDRALHREASTNNRVRLADASEVVKTLEQVGSD